MIPLVITIREQRPTAGESATTTKLYAAQWATTTRLYAAQWQRWETWAVDNGVDSAELSYLEEYLTDMGRGGASMSAIKQARAGILAVYQDRMESIRERPAGITRDGLEAIRDTAQRPRSTLLGKRETRAHARVRARVDVALVAVMRDAMLRPAETATITWGDVERDPDGSGTVYIHRPRDPVGQNFYLGPPTMQALNAMSPFRPDPRDFVFELSPKQITRRIQAAARAAGLPGNYSGDSPRLGMAQDLATARGPVALYYSALAA